ncbi:MAG: polyphosphate kinase 1 [Chitinispirillaceae bacterium]
MPIKRPSYINRELSWLEFNIRVLEEAEDETIPLLERAKFLAITGSNLDEFFMVRVGSLHQLVAEGVTRNDAAGMSPTSQLSAISKKVRALVIRQYECLRRLFTALGAEKISYTGTDSLNQRQLVHVQQVFETEIYPIVTPMAVELDFPLPLLKNLGLNCIVRLSPRSKSMRPRFAIVPVGSSLERFIGVPQENGYSFVFLEEIICRHIKHLFSGEKIAECIPFRITRNADMAVREDYASDLLLQMEEVLDQRKESACVRLEIKDSVSSVTLSFLKRLLNVSEDDIYHLPGPLQLSDLMGLLSIPGYEHLRYESWPPQSSPQADLRTSLFTTLKKHPILLNHPYDSFEPVIKLLQEAADDPDVLAIKQILYRTSKKSPIIDALKDAAQKGKYVTVIVELKARFDEAQNIEWARELEQSGIQVIYGVKGLKTHAKLMLIVRREPSGIVRYLHFGTGNYNESTARLYSDISYMTKDEKLASDASAFFNSITGYSQPKSYYKLVAAPLGLREELLGLIADEIERKRHGQKALIMAKMNSLVDVTLIDALYEASQAGVRIMLNIRGICCLRPGIKNLSENITVTSIIDRFLEHSRIFYFYHGGEEKTWITSADWMPRNLDRRVELMTPVLENHLKNQLIDILHTYFNDTVKARKLMPDGHYERVKPTGRRKPLRSQEQLYLRSVEAVRKMQQRRKTVFEPYRPSEQEVE